MRFLKILINFIGNNSSWEAKGSKIIGKCSGGQNFLPLTYKCTGFPWLMGHHIWAYAIAYPCKRAYFVDIWFQLFPGPLFSLEKEQS